MFFPIVLYIQDVPTWWVFRNVKLLDIATPSQLILEVSPKTPHNIGEEITATVTNSSSQLPVQKVLKLKSQKMAPLKKCILMQTE